MSKRLWVREGPGLRGAWGGWAWGSSLTQSIDPAGGSQEAEEAGVRPQAAQSPCSTGFVKHTPTKLRAPAYSFRGAPMLLAENCSPGPRYSVNPKILRTGKDLGPAFSILGRYSTKTLLTPGPGEWPPQPSPSRRRPLRALASQRCEGQCLALLSLSLCSRGGTSRGAADLSATHEPPEPPETWASLGPVPTPGACQTLPHPAPQFCSIYTLGTLSNLSNLPCRGP